MGHVGSIIDIQTNIIKNRLHLAPYSAARTDVSTTCYVQRACSTYLPTYLPPSIESSMKICRGKYRIDTICRPKKAGRNIVIPSFGSQLFPPF